jgi:hypothetical protein
MKERKKKQWKLTWGQPFSFVFYIDPFYPKDSIEPEAFATFGNLLVVCIPDQ